MSVDKLKPSIRKALISLQGLSVGDAFGEQFFNPVNCELISEQILPEGPWSWTDDTCMALSIVDILWQYGGILQDELARSFAQRFVDNPFRGYGGGAIRHLINISNGDDWRKSAENLFKGGSFGNGAAMRVAPLGGFYFGQPKLAAEEAEKSAVVTHSHPEGIAGAVAVAVAAAIAARDNYPQGNDFIEEAAGFVPQSETRRRMLESLKIEADEVEKAGFVLGTGEQVSAQDTAPFCIWCAAHSLKSFGDALWKAVSIPGDLDTVGAIVGGIVALSANYIPQSWIERREPVPEYLSGFMMDLF